MITYAERSAKNIRELVPVPMLDPIEARQQYCMLFLVQYRACYSINMVTEDAFLEAYDFYAMAARYGADMEALDEEAYKIRRQWSEKGE